MDISARQLRNINIHYDALMEVKVPLGVGRIIDACGLKGLRIGSARPG